jgi:hypothetical protein
MLAGMKATYDMQSVKMKDLEEQLEEAKCQRTAVAQVQLFQRLGDCDNEMHARFSLVKDIAATLTAALTALEQPRPDVAVAISLCKEGVWYAAAAFGGIRAAEQEPAAVQQAIADEYYISRRLTAKRGAAALETANLDEIFAVHKETHKAAKKRVANSSTRADHAAAGPVKPLPPPPPYSNRPSPYAAQGPWVPSR